MNLQQKRLKRELVQQQKLEQGLMALLDLLRKRSEPDPLQEEISVCIDETLIIIKEERSDLNMSRLLFLLHQQITVV